MPPAVSGASALPVGKFKQGCHISGGLPLTVCPGCAGIEAATGDISPQSPSQARGAYLWTKCPEAGPGYFSKSFFLSGFASSGGCFSFHSSSSAMICSFILGEAFRCVPAQVARPARTEPGFPRLSFPPSLRSLFHLPFANLLFCGMKRASLMAGL